MPQKIARREIVRLESLKEMEKQRLVDELYELNGRIFSGVEKDEFRRRINRKQARWNKVAIYRKATGEPVGYCGLHLFDLPAPNCGGLVIRAETGILREYRGSGSTIRLCLADAIRCKLRHPRLPLYIFCTLVHPSSYHLLHKYFLWLYPHPQRATPPAIATRMERLADHFGEPRIEGTSALICDTGWQTRDNEEELAFWAASPQPDVRFFLQQNPGYGQGHGLVTLIPLTFSNLLGAALIYGWKQLRRLNPMVHNARHEELL